MDHQQSQTTQPSLHFSLSRPISKDLKNIHLQLHFHPQDLEEMLGMYIMHHRSVLDLYRMYMLPPE